jgi:hypothetical protein
MSRLALAAEVYGFDPYYHNVFARAGFSFLAREQWSLHVVVDAHDEAGAASALSTLRTIATRQGREIDGSLPPAIRADPFGAVRLVLLGPEGEKAQAGQALTGSGRTGPVLQSLRISRSC